MGQSAVEELQASGPHTEAVWQLFSVARWLSRRLLLGGGGMWSSPPAPIAVEGARWAQQSISQDPLSSSEELLGFPQPKG